MVSLTAHFKTTKYLLDEGEVVLKHRPYLGMSQLGHECSRYLWYQFRWAFEDTTSKRMVRLWNRGHREEPEIIKALNGIGVDVWGDQTEMLAGHGHIKGHNDGICKGVVEAPKTIHLAEFKTVKDSGFKELQKKRLEKYSPTYWAQCQLYMHFLKLTRTLFIAVNKNDDSYYVERIYYEKAEAMDLIRKGESIILADCPPDRAFPSKTFFKCRWCSANQQCWEDAPLQKNCRTCKSCELCIEGEWSCSELKEGNRIPDARQRIGCDLYRGLNNE